MRVQAVVSELRGEKIDIIPWAPIEEEFVANALSPAHVVKTYLDESTKTARAVVPDNHLSLAIGKEGQNARLAARLTGWRIDIKSQEQMAQILAKEAFERATPKDDEIEDILEQDRLPAQEPEIGAVDAANRDELEETEIDTIGEEDEFAAAVRGQDLDQETVVHEPQELEHLEELPLEEDLEDEVPVYADEDSEPLEPTAVDDDLDDDFDELDDLEEESGDVEPELDDDSLWRKRTPKPAAVLGKAKSRKTRKQDLESLLEEELTEEEPLPTLFSGDEQQDEVEVYVAGPQDDESGFTLAGRLDLKDIKLQGDDDKGKKKGKGKKTLKDLADLRWEFDE